MQNLNKGSNAPRALHADAAEFVPKSQLPRQYGANNGTTEGIAADKTVSPSDSKLATNRHVSVVPEKETDGIVTDDKHVTSAVDDEHNIKQPPRFSSSKSSGQSEALGVSSRSASALSHPSTTAHADFQGKSAISAKDEILDSWEDVSSVAGPTTALNKEVVSSIPSRYSYTKQELFGFRLERSTVPPHDLPSFSVERSPTVDFKGNRRLGPGGATRGGGAGAGGGGSGGGSGSHRYGGSMEDPRRDQSLRHGTDAARGGRHRKAEHTSASDKWDRGHRVKQKEGTSEHWGPDPVDPLKTTVHRWDRKQKAASALDASLNMVVSILNKMTPQNFEKLSGQLCDLEITSSEMLRQVIGVIFDKAVDEPHFAVVYAALCVRLAEVTRVWPFIRPVKDTSNETWSWIADLEVDTSKLLPLPDISAVEMVLSSSDTEREEIGVGQLQLHPSDCFLQKNKLVCCYSAKQRPGVVFAVVEEDAKASLFGDGKTKLFGRFATKEEAQQDAMKKASFKRLLLNQCQEEFEKNVRHSCSTAALEAAAREAKEKAKNAAIEAARIAEETGLPPKEAPEDLELEVWVMKLKRRMLGNVKFIGELFKKSLLKEKTMHECIKLLLGSLDDPHVVPDDESIEAAAKLFLTIGKQLESPSTSKAKLDAYCKRLAALSKDTARLAARTRFMLQDLLECRRNGWKERRAKDGPHKLGTKAPVQQQQSKSDSQYRRDQERQLARERQRQAVSQQQQSVSGTSTMSASCSQDVRQLRHRQSSAVRILARDHEVPKMVPTDDSMPGDPDPNATVILWTDDRVTNRARSTLDEYEQLSDLEELVTSLDEVPSANRIYRRVFELSVSRIIEGKDSERSGAFRAIRALMSKEKLKSEDVNEAILKTLKDLPDINIDSPKAIEHVANLLCVILKLGIIEVPWLKHGFGGDNHIREHKILLERLELFLSEDPEQFELKRQVAELVGSV